MRILFLGTVEFSRHCLNEVLKEGGDVVAVLSLAEERAGFHSDYADLSDVAAEYGLEVTRIRNINDPQTVALIQGLEPDVIFVFGWSQLISKTVLDIPPIGCIGTHPTLLPLNRGRHPVVWALVDGLEESGLTFFYMDEGADSGDILWQESFPITLDDDAQTLYKRIEGLASKAIKGFLPQLAQGTAPRFPQNHRHATYRRKRGEKDGQIDWQAPSMTTYNLTRALTRPYVGAHTYVDTKLMKIWRTVLPREPLPPSATSLEPGTVFAVREPEFDVRTGDGYLTVVEYDHQGRMPVAQGAKLGDCG